MTRTMRSYCDAVMVAMHTSVSALAPALAGKHDCINECEVLFDGALVAGDGATGTTSRISLALILTTGVCVCVGVDLYRKRSEGVTELKD
eukprot:m.7786 g.7786  ORF g.7786 m.7786 type:complete len:90 (-) comp5290_c1_seq1:489-758(-)